MIKWISVLAVGTAVFITGCASMKPYSSNTQAMGQEGTLGAGTVAGVPIGGSIAGSMDENDRVKLTRALDKAPGKATDWTNANSGTHYTVTPIRKLTVNGNGLCRQYQVVAERSGQSQQMTGTACVASDGAWSEVRG